MIIQKILGNSAFWIVNKEIAGAAGIEAALLLADLIDKQAYFTNRGELDEEGYFYNTAKDIEKNTTLTYHKQKEAMRSLHAAGFLDCKLKGVPAKLHFKIIENKILNFLNTGILESANLDVKEMQTNNNKENNNKENNIIVEPKETFASTLFQEEEISNKPQPKKEKDPAKAKTTIFKNSTSNDFELIKEKFKNEIEAGIDLQYYFDCVFDWSEQNIGKKRTATGWIATIRTFMRGDNGKGRLRMINTGPAGSPPVMSEAMKKYLSA